MLLVALIVYFVVSVVEDGGLSWLKKSYQRMKEQAEREKRDLEEIVAERYGVSTEKRDLYLLENNCEVGK